MIHNYFSDVLCNLNLIMKQFLFSEFLLYNYLEQVLIMKQFLFLELPESERISQAQTGGQ